MLSNLLQELTIAQRMGRKKIILDEERLNENPRARMTRLIRDQFWVNLTRKIDEATIADIAYDSKSREPGDVRRIYIPHGEAEQYEYFCAISKSKPEIHLDVVYLPENITPEYVRDINDRPGLLALALKQDEDGKLSGMPYVVPGGRFNEFYGWDSYMVSLGLILHGRVDLAQSMVENFCFEIRHYGKILNANRSYYLCRSQPPFLTDMTRRVYDKIKEDKNSKQFLKRALSAAIKEYHTVWMAAPRLDPVTGLSRYRPDGIGVPPETEASHFRHILEPFAEKHGMSAETFEQAYNNGEVHDTTLDEFFLHDRAVRESGHDTTYRLEGICADLATVDLNSLLYKYEVDIADLIRGEFNDSFVTDSGATECSATWDRKARRRAAIMNRYMWNEADGLFYDYNTKLRKITNYESCTTFWTMWAGLATPKQAAALVEKALPKFEMYGGLVSSTEKSRGPLGPDRPSRQWDYPFGWAPQQMLAWRGLRSYGYKEEAERLAYRWLFMLTKAFVDYNGIIVEKYDVTREVDPHRVEAEYGNQGAGFKGVPTEGFGWANASYIYGQTYLRSRALRALGALTRPDNYTASLEDENEAFEAHLSS